MAKTDKITVNVVSNANFNTKEEIFNWLELVCAVNGGSYEISKMVDQLFTEGRIVITFEGEVTQDIVITIPQLFKPN